MDSLGQRGFTNAFRAAGCSMTKKTYSDSLSVERKSREILKPWLQQYCDEGRYVLTDKGRLSKAMQERFGDALAQRNGAAVWVELKAEKDFTNNFFIEEWSNRSRGNPGWLYKLDADLLFYHFLDVNILYLIDFQQLKKWLLSMPPDFCRYKTSQINLCQYPEKRQAKYDQKNDTWGRLVPIRDISDTKHVRMAIEIVGKWRQGQVDLEAQEI